MALQFGNILDSIFSTIINPNTIIGTGLTLGSTLPRSEPGSVTEARQFLRNQFASPTGLTSQFTNQLNALNQQYLPLLQQQENELLNNVQQRAIAGLPTSLSTGMGGGEILGIRNAVSRDILPRRQAALADLARDLMNRQTGSAGILLGENTGNSLAQALGNLGGSFLNRGFGGDNLLGIGGGGTGQSLLDRILAGSNQTGRGPLGTIIDSFGGGNQGGLAQTLGLTGSSANSALASTLASSIQGLLGNTPIGAFELVQPGVMGVLGEGGQLLATIGQNGNIVSQINGQILGNINQIGVGGAAGTGGQASLLSRLTGGGGLVDTSRMFAGQGLFGTPGFGSLQGLLSGAGSGLAGFGLGNMIGGQLPGTQAGSGLGGAGAGALAGFAIGGPLGAAIGALAGLGGGVLGSHNAAAMEKALARSADLQSAGTNEASIEQFWTEALGAAGVDISPFMESAQRYGPGQVDLIAAEGAGQLIRAINAGKPESQWINSLDQIPGFRDRYISWIMSHNMIEQGGQSTPVQNIGQQGALLSSAGLQAAPGTSPTSQTLAVGPNITHSFSNPDSPTLAEMESLAAKVRAAGYTGPHAADLADLLFRYTSGRIAVQVANGLVYSAMGSPNHIPENIFRQSGIPI